MSLRPRSLHVARVLAAAAFLLAPSLAAVGQVDDPGERVEVIELRGTLDSRVLRFALESIQAAADSGSVEVAVLQLDSPGVLGGPDELRRLLEIVADPPLPLAVWVGPAPAVAYGGAFQLLAAAPFAGVAPGSEIGHALPAIAGSDDLTALVEIPPGLDHDALVIEEGEATGVVDVVQPSLRQFVTLDLDGREMEVGGRRVTLSTVVPFTAEDGSEGVTNLPTVIREPDVWDQFLRLASTPEAAFFFLVAGLTVAAFEFYAVGPGVAAGVAALSLLLAGYGIAVLPVRGWSLGLAVASVVALAAAHQAGGLAILTLLGIAGLTVAGFSFTDAAPQVQAGAAGVVLTVAAAAFFFLLAMPTVARARFSTRTIGREGMIGRTGLALGPLRPDGEITVDGARWKATSHREAGIDRGDEVVVTGVDGWYLEVEPRT